MADLIWAQYLGKGRVFILKNYVPYHDEVVKYLNLIRTTHTGRTLLKHLDRATTYIAIQPYTPTKKDPVNAYAAFQNEADAYTKNQLIIRKYDIPVVGQMKFPVGIGTGAGSNVNVYYHPANQREFVKRQHWIPPGSGPGETLFHELVHALREAEGVFLRTDVPENEKMDDFEEFCAILAANIYRSERGFKIMRDAHWGYEAVSKDLSNPEHYYDFYEDEIVKWFRSQQKFCLDLAQSAAAFNPLKFAAIDLKLIPQPTTPMALPTSKASR